MATFRSGFGPVVGKAEPNQLVQAMVAGEGTDISELTTSGTAGLLQSGGSDFIASQAGVLTFFCDGAVWVKVGTGTPTAAVGVGFPFKANERGYLFIKSGEKVSVIDDS